MSMDILDEISSRIKSISKVTRMAPHLCTCLDGDDCLCDFCSDFLFLLGDSDSKPLGVIDTSLDFAAMVKR